MHKFDTHTLDTIKKTITEFKLIEDSQKVTIALSGGKDSIFLALHLRELGYEIEPLTVDMGYSPNWKEEILLLGDKVGLGITVLNAKGEEVTKQLSLPQASFHQDSIKFLEEFDFKSNINVTPCTQCYNVKLLAINTHLKRNGEEKVAFGFHATDAIVSFLKSTIMFMDRWDAGHTTFNRNNFIAAVEDLRSIVLRNTFTGSNFFNRLKELTLENLVATDEPPLKKVSIFSEEVLIVSPLFAIPEFIIQEFMTKNSIATQGSGCGHGATQSTQTPREIIHWDLIWKITNKETLDSFQRQLMQLVKLGITRTGELMRDVRKERSKILGETYKPDGLLCNKF